MSDQVRSGLSRKPPSLQSGWGGFAGPRRENAEGVSLRWPKRSLLDDPEEEMRAAALIAARRAGLADDGEESWLGLRGPLDGAATPGPGTESGAFLDYSATVRRPDPRPLSARGGSSPPVGRVLLNHHIDIYLATTQGLSERDLRGAAPLPEALSRFVLKPGEGSAATIDELRPLLVEEARKLGHEIVVRRTGENGELGFALRPEASSRILDDDRPGAGPINRAAQIADGLGRLFGLNGAGPLKVGRAGSAARTTAPAASAASIRLTGKELGEFGDDLKAWIAAGSEAYKKIRDQGPIANSAIGGIRFTGLGLDKMRFTGADPRKWQLVPALPQIIHTGELISTATASKQRTDGIVKSHWLETNVTLDGKALRVGVHVGVDARGNKFYNLNQDIDAWARKNQPPGVALSNDTGVRGAAGGKASTTADIGAGDDGINLYILGPAVLAATRAEGR